MMSHQTRTNNWVDGLRGIAALVVVTYHLCSSFANWLNSPATQENGEVFFFQYPFLRLVVAGRLAVALFFIITGYVNSFYSFKQIRAGDHTLVLSKLSRNTITRVGKLVVPTNIAIFFSWLVCQLDGYRVAKQVDSSWIRVVAAGRGPTFSRAILGLYRNLVLFWHGGTSPYDPVYWTIPFFLKGSMLVYLTLMATTFTRPKFTKWLLIFLYCFAWSGGQALMETNVYAGMFLAELNADYGAQAPSMMPWPISVLMMLGGLFLASFPDENPTWVPWSRALNSLAQYIVPTGGEINRYVVSFGTTLFVFGVFFSRQGRQILSHPFMNFLGRISFPIYLLHDTLIRTILSWFIYRQSIFQKGLSPTDHEGKPMWFERGGTLTFAIAMPLFYIILIYIAHLWTIYVDPPCGRLVLWFSKQAFGEDDDSALMNKEKLEGILKT